MKIDNIVIGIQAQKYENCVNLIKLAKEKNIKIISLECGDILKIDKGTFLEVFFPNKKYVVQENKINNNSLVFKLNYQDISILFTGDIEEVTEQYLCLQYGDKLHADILKVAHHGSKTSSTEKFLQYVNPKIALIGVGKNNKFGHPNDKVLKRLEKMRN